MIAEFAKDLDERGLRAQFASVGVPDNAQGTAIVSELVVDIFKRFPDGRWRFEEPYIAVIQIDDGVRESVEDLLRDLTSYLMAIRDRGTDAGWVRVPPN